MARSLSLSLGFAGGGLRVGYRLDGARFEAGAVVARLPVRVAGVPAISLASEDLKITDEEGPVGVWSDIASPEGAGDLTVRWHADRATRGVVQVAYLARARVVDGATSDGHPPVDLRVEAGGVTGPGRAFLALPPLEGPWDLSVRWVLATGRGQVGVCSLGAGTLIWAPGRWRRCWTAISWLAVGRLN
jgi:hypothetical protein